MDTHTTGTGAALTATTPRSGTDTATAARTALQLARIAVLLVLARATAGYVMAFDEAQGRVRIDEVWGPWAAVVAVYLAFVVVMLVGRRRHHPWIVLAIEACAAGVVALVPPLQWILWLGIGGWVSALGAGSAPPLAMAWLGVVGQRAFHQFRGRGRAPDGDDRGTHVGTAGRGRHRGLGGDATGRL